MTAASDRIQRENGAVRGRALALTRTAAPTRPEDDWPWPAIRDVAVETLLRVVHDLGAPTQARVDAASALLAASTARTPDPKESP